MDLKKVLDQTVRELKREVNKKVLKVPEIEQKVYEATSNEPWGPHGTLMGDIAQATRNYNEYQMIMAILWKRLNDTGKNWRHVYKALTVLEFLVANGAERIIDELREHAYQVQTLVDFQYLEAGGKDQGINVRKKAQTLVGLLNDKEKIREVRNKAASNRDKYRGSGTVFRSKSSKYSSTDGGYGDREDEDRYGASSRSGGRDEDGRYAGNRDRERDRDDRYRDDDRSGKDTNGDRYRDDKYGGDRDRTEDDRSYGGKGGDRGYNDRYGDEGSASGYDKDRERNYEEEDRYPARGGGGNRADRGDPPEYPGEERDASGLAAAVARAQTSQTQVSQPQASATASQNGERKLQAAGSSGGSYFATKQDEEEFDDFDPRGAFSATGSARQDEDPFGSSAPAPPPAAAPVIPPPTAAKSTSGIEDLFGDNSFLAAPTGSSFQGNGVTVRQDDPFGEPAFSVDQPSTAAFGAQPTSLFPSAGGAANVVSNDGFQAFPPAPSNEGAAGNATFGASFSAAPPVKPPALTPPPSYQQSPILQQQTPSYQPQAPNYQQQAPNYQQQAPNYQQQAPSYQQHGHTQSAPNSFQPPPPGKSS